MRHNTRFHTCYARNRGLLLMINLFFIVAWRLVANTLAVKRVGGYRKPPRLHLPLWKRSPPPRPSGSFDQGLSMNHIVASASSRTHHWVALSVHHVIVSRSYYLMQSITNFIFITRSMLYHADRALEACRPEPVRCEDHSSSLCYGWVVDISPNLLKPLRIN